MLAKSQAGQGSARSARCMPTRACARGRVRTKIAAVNPVAGEKYDYIIVGGGAAGCVLANKLSADGGKKVLVLEAGSTNTAIEVAVPAGITRLFKHPVLDWGLTTTNQKQLESREMYLARGKLLGGSSSTNATLYHRGTASDYDSWNLDGWRSSDVLPHFMQAESYTNGSRPYHGQGGLMRVEQPRYENPLHDVFFQSAAAIGLKPNSDFNNWEHPQEGYGEFQVTQSRGERADMYRMYLKPAMSRGNLKVLTGACTTQVQFENKKARGVTFSTEGPQGEKHAAELTANGEVIMCAGAVHTPHIMMLSGLGPAASLLEHGIAPLVDLPGVGANLQDHPGIVVSAKMKEEYNDLSVTAQLYDGNNNLMIKPILEYLINRTGPLTTTGCDHGAFIRTAGQAEPDLQMRFVPAFCLDPDGVSAYAKFGELKKLGLNWPAGLTMQLLAVRAKSKGSVGLNSTNPFDKPALNISYLSDPEGADLATLKAGVSLARDVLSSQPMKPYIAEEVYPGSEDLETFIRRSVHSGNALVGTCRMGKSAQEGAVVSSHDLKVFGVEGLRVVDASVIPVITGGQTGAPAVMIAERAANAILFKTGFGAAGAKQAVAA